MDLPEMSDAQIREVAEVILADSIRGSNAKDWPLFSKHMPPEDRTEEAKAHVEREWREEEYLTALSENPVFMGIIRKTEGVIVVWKQTSALSQNEYLEKLHLQTIDGEIRQTAIWLE